MRLRVTCLLLLILCLLPRVSVAQAPTSYTANYYNVGAASPVQSETFLATAVSCNQGSPAATSTVNPTRLVWDDPANSGKVCIFAEGPSGPLFSVPIGNYEGTFTATNAAGSSAESARAPFSRQPLPAVPANFKVVR